VGWFAGVGFWSGEASWALSIQRTDSEGSFEPPDKLILGQLVNPLSEVATLSKALRYTVVASITNALGLVKQPAIALDRLGFVIDTNEAADALFGDDLRVSARRLVIQDKEAAAVLAKMLAQVRSTPDTKAFASPDPILVHRDGRANVLLRQLPLPPAARGPFLGARLLLTLIELAPKRAPDPVIVARAFGLSRAEARLASLLAIGVAPQEAAARLGTSPETVRSQLKMIFAKTDTHRQSELTALLARV
jgi:DNA-binding CsgD family transcriptional regulator